jgi:hypothetical protein
MKRIRFKPVQGKKNSDHLFLVSQLIFFLLNDIPMSGLINGVALFVQFLRTTDFYIVEFYRLN